MPNSNNTNKSNTYPTIADYIPGKQIIKKSAQKDEIQLNLFDTGYYLNGIFIPFEAPPKLITLVESGGNSIVQKTYCISLRKLKVSQLDVII